MNNKRFLKALGLIIVVALLAAALPLQAKAQTGGNTLYVAEWSEPAATGVTGRETVLFDGTNYHMWYSSSDEKTLYHTSSTDPASFDAGTAVTFPTDYTPFEVGSVSVVKEGSTFYMIAYGATNKVFAIYTSTDGNAWTYGGVVFDGTGLPAYNKIDGPFLFKDGSIYRLYFQVKTPETSPNAYYIYTAESTAASLAVIAGTGDTVDFALANNNLPVLSPGDAGAWDSASVMHPWVVKDGDVYYMWYSARGSGKPQSLGMAKSEDGIEWVKSPGNPIFVTATGYAEPSVITDGETWQMWTMGTGGVINYLTAKGPFEFQSIQAAINAATAGDTINVAAGTYSTANGETFPIAINKGNLTIKGAQFDVDPTAPGVRTDESQESIIDATGAEGNAVEIGTSGETLSGVTFNGFTVKNATTALAAITVGNPASDHTMITTEDLAISNNILTSSKRGLAIYDNKDSLFKTNRIINNSDIAIYVAAAESSTVIDGNVITGNHSTDGYGGITVTTGKYTGGLVIPIVTGSTGVTGAGVTGATVATGDGYPDTQPTITNNYIDNNGLMGIKVHRASAIIRGNTVTNHTFNGIYAWDQADRAPAPIVEGNIVTNNGSTDPEDEGQPLGGIVVIMAHTGPVDNKILIKGNTIVENKPWGILLSNSMEYPSIDIEDNLISGNTSDGIYFWSNYEKPNVNIKGNTITNNGNDGILIDKPTGGICQPVIHLNSIYGNGKYGLENKDLEVMIDATSNWWGSAAGPAVGAVVGNVDYEPWCGDEACETFMPDEGVIDLTPPEGGESPEPEEIQAAINNAPSGSTIVIPEGDYAHDGAFTVSTPNLTIVLSDGTVIQNESPCFVINADDTSIIAEPGAKCIPTGGANGIDVAAGLTDIRIEGLEIDGTGQSTGDGINFAGAVTNLTLLNNNIHGLDGDGIEFAGQPGGAVIIRGNTITDNGEQDVNADDFAVDVTRNYWGVATGPTTEKITIGVTFAPWCADQGCSLYATNVAALDPTDRYGIHEGKVYAGYAMMDGAEQIPLTAENLYSFWAKAPGETEFTKLEVGDDTDPNLWFNVEKVGGLYEYVARAKNGLTYTSTLNWTEASDAEFAATGGFGKHEDDWYTEFQMKDAEGNPISLAVGEVKLIAQKVGTDWVELTPNTDTTLWFNIAHETGEYEFLVVTKDDAVYTATLAWTAKVDAMLESTETFGIHDGKVYAGYKMMAGGVQVPLDITNLASFWSKAPEQDPVELTLDEDPLLWFNVEKAAGTYEYTAVTKTGQVYQASLEWTGASTAAFKATGGFGEHEGVWYTEFQMLDADTPISLAIGEVKLIAQKVGTNWVELTPNTDETLWFNIAHETGEYEFLVVTSEDVVYTATLAWTAKVNATLEPIDRYGIHDGKVYAGYKMMAGGVQVRLDTTNLASFWSKAPEQDPVQLTLDEDPLLWFNVEKVAGTYEYTAVTKTGQVYQASLTWTEASTAAFKATGGFGEHEGVLYTEFRMEDTEGNLISLHEDYVKLIATKDAEGNWVALEPNTDTTLWFNIAHATGTYEFLVVTSEDVVYTATLEWEEPTAATLESTETFGFHDGKVYAGYKMMAGGVQVRLDTTNLASFWSKAPGGVPVSLTLDEDPLLWFNVEKAAGTYEYTAVTTEGQIYQASLEWTGALAADFASTGMFGEHDGVIYQEFEMLDGDTPISLAVGEVKLIATKDAEGNWVELTPNTDETLWFNVELAEGDYEFLVVTSEDVVYTATLAWPGPNVGEFIATGQFVVVEGMTSIEFQLLDAEGNPISLASVDLKLIAQKDEEDDWVPFPPGTDETLWLDEDYPDGIYEFLVVTSDEVVYTATLEWVAPKDATLEPIDSYGVHLGKVYAGYEMLDDEENQIPLIASNIASFWALAPGETEYVELVVEGEDDPYLWFNVEKGYGTYKYKAITTAGVMYDAEIVWTPPMVANFAATGGFGEHDGILYKEFQMLDGTLPISLAVGDVKLITQKVGADWVELTPNEDVNLWFNIAKPTGNYYFLVVTEDGRIYKATLEWVAPTAATLESTETFGIHDGKVYAGYKMMAGGVQVRLDTTNLASFWSKAPGQDPVQLTLDEDPLLWFNVEKAAGTYEYTAVTIEGQIYQASLTWTEASEAEFEATGGFGEHEGETYKEFKMVDSEGNPISLAIGAVKLIAEKGPEEVEWVALEPNTDETLWFNIANALGNYEFLVVTNANVIYKATLEWAELHAPVAEDIEVETDEDVAVEIELQASDEDGDELTAEIVERPENGEVVLEGFTVTYTPDLDFNGTDSFTYKVNDGLLDSNIATVTITIVPVNDAPVAEDIEAETDEDTPVEIELVASDVDGDELTAALEDEPEHGEVTIDGLKATYTPEADFNGTDSFTYKVNDGTEDSNIATVTITIVPVNDAPVAEDITAETDEDTPVEIELVASDVDGDELTAEIVGEPEHGEVVLEGFKVTYTPELDFNGTDSFTYKVNDGTADSNIATVTITVKPVNDGPIAVDDEYETLMGKKLEVPAELGVLANDIDPDPTDVQTVELKDAPLHGELVLNTDGSFTYEPDAGFYGVDTFTYWLISVPGVQSSGYTDWATVTITVRPAARIFLPIILK